MGNLGSDKSNKKRLLLIGEYFAGKTTLLYWLKINKIEYDNENILKIEQVETEKYIITSWDTLPYERPKKYSDKYYADADGIIFMIDSTNKDLLDDVKKELWELLEVGKLKNKPILIFANKQEHDESLSIDYISEFLNIKEIKERQSILLGCSLKNDIGVKEGFDWLAQILV